MLSASFISTLIGTKLPGDGALCFSQNLDFLRPIRIGDKIKIIAKVTKKNISNQVVDLSIEILNQHKQKVIIGSVSVKITDNKIISKKDKKKIQSNLSTSNDKIKKPTHIADPDNHVLLTQNIILERDLQNKIRPYINGVIYTVPPMVEIGWIILVIIGRKR